MTVTDSQPPIDISTKYQKNHVQLKIVGKFSALLVSGLWGINRRTDRVEKEYYFNLYFYWMERVLSALQLKVSWKQSMRKSCRSNKLNVDLVSYFTPLRMRSAYEKFLKMYEKKGDDRIERWLENELKAFYWICVAMSCIEELPIASFSQAQWAELNEIFFCKGKLTLEYEAKKLIQNITHRPFWEVQEDNVLTAIVQNNGPQSNKWNDFARKLYETSERKFIRTGKQCRERWLNHLDPTKKHGEWTCEEQKNIVTLLLCFGKKWSKIAKTLGNSRTQHMIKNRFKTICSRQRKAFPFLKTQEQLLKSFVQPVSAKQEQEPPKTATTIMEIKAQHNSSENEQVGSPEEDFQDMDLNELIQQDNKGKHLHSGNSFDMPQVFSPWYVGIPITPTFSPSVPFLVNFSAGFSSFDSHCANQFYCPKKSNENCFDHQ